MRTLLLTGETASLSMMSPALKSDLDGLQREHAIDDAMIESLLGSKAQARAHLAFWTQMMWLTNLAVIGLCLGVFGLCVRYAVPAGVVWAWGLAGLSLALALWMVRTLRRQQRVLVSVRQVATRHDLI